ncbi:MAG: hypothetical protein AAFW89_15250, partial [Bacteroidota bacterium]
MQHYFDYILSTFFMIYSCELIPVITYGETRGDIRIADRTSSFFQSTSPAPPYVHKKVWKSTEIPFLSTDSATPETIIEHTESGVQIRMDIIGSAFYFLSGWQEYHSQKRDDFGRYPYQESFQYQHGYMKTPVVNYYFDILKQAIEQVTNTKVTRKLWPDDDIAISISHDIDKINGGWKEDGLHALKKGRGLEMTKLLFRRLFKKDTWENIDDILHFEKTQGIRSTFFFLPKKDKFNADYKLEQVQPYFDDIERQGSEIGVHGSLGTGVHAHLLETEIKRFDRAVYGNRFHFLSAEPSAYGTLIEDSGLTYDTTMGFAEHIGFRHGYCFPFYPYDIVHQRPFSFIELPLTIMDATLRNPAYMGGSDDVEEALEHLVREVCLFNGLLTILWHNNFYTDGKFKSWKSRLT